MKKYCKALVNLGVAFIILLLIVFLVPKLLVFFAPFVAGWIIALIASPLVRFFEEKVKIKRKAGSAFVIVAVIALVILILYLVGAKLTDEIMGLIGALPDIWDSAENDFADIGQNLSVIYNRFPADVQQSIMDVINQIGSYVGDLLGKIGTPTINAVGNFAKQVPSILIGLSWHCFLPISLWLRETNWQSGSVSIHRRKYCPGIICRSVDWSKQ